MKHTATRILFAYWDELRGERSAPDRADVQPGGMRQILSDAFVLSSEADVVFRHAGSRICALFCRDMAGIRFADLWPPADSAEIERIIGFVTLDTTGVVLGALGANVNGSELAMEMLLLPLRQGRRSDTRILGALSPSTVPSWAGLVPLTELRLRTVRTIDTHPRDLGGPDFTAPDAARRAFMVHEGSRA